MFYRAGGGLRGAGAGGQGPQGAGAGGLPVPPAGGGGDPARPAGAVGADGPARPGPARVVDPGPARRRPRHWRGQVGEKTIDCEHFSCRYIYTYFLRCLGMLGLMQ